MLASVLAALIAQTPTVIVGRRWAVDGQPLELRRYESKRGLVNRFWVKGVRHQTMAYAPKYISAGALALSRDGSFAVFDAIDATGNSIYLWPTRTKKIQRLATVTNPASLSWAPDGRTFSLLSYATRDGRARKSRGDFTGIYDLMVFDRKGAVVRRAQDIMGAAWTPDSRIAFWRIESKAFTPAGKILVPLNLKFTISAGTSSPIYQGRLQALLEKLSRQNALSIPKIDSVFNNQNVLTLAFAPDMSGLYGTSFLPVPRGEDGVMSTEDALLFANGPTSYFRRDQITSVYQVDWSRNGKEIFTLGNPLFVGEAGKLEWQEDVVYLTRRQISTGKVSWQPVVRGVGTLENWRFAFAE